VTKLLSSAAVRSLPGDVLAPSFDRQLLRPGVVHLGIGAFHRAHQAVYLDDAVAAGDHRWGIVGVSLRSPQVRDMLAAQDCYYSLAVRDGDQTRYRIIGALTKVLVAPEDPAAVIAALAHPDAHLVTLTITEKGYKLDRATGRLDMTDANVAADFQSLAAPRTAAGFIVAGLAQRRKAGLAPLTAISCDNLSGNGQLLRQAVLQLAQAHDLALADWIREQGAFPDTMVDRIVPATSDTSRAMAQTALGVRDDAVVVTEPFSQWVVEDDFAGEHPGLAAFGVQMTDDVAPWEVAKLRLLNGAHSMIAYLGALSGHAHVHDFVMTEKHRQLVEKLWAEALATLQLPPALNAQTYCQQLMSRFANSALNHRTVQIAMDGSQKLPQRLVAPLLARDAMGLESPTLCLAIAAWMRWQSGVDEQGQHYQVDDPLADTTSAIWRTQQAGAGLVDALLGLKTVFATQLAPASRDAIGRWLELLRCKGAQAVIDAALTTDAGHEGDQ
jgi:fructuronate reductase